MVLRWEGPDFGGVPLLAMRWLSGLNTWMWIATALAWSYRWLNRPFAWLDYANRAVYPWYILHQSLIVLLAWWLIPKQLGPVVEPALLIGGTVLGCAVLHHFVIRPLRPLHPFFGLKTVPRTGAPETAPRLAA